MSDQTRSERSVAGTYTRAPDSSTSTVEQSTHADVDPTLARRETARQQRNIGVPVVDQGMACDGLATSGCFLSNQARRDLVSQLSGRIATASTNYKAAIDRVRTTKLFEKAPDPSLLTTVIIDVLAFYVGGAIGGALAHLRTSGGKAIGELATTKFLQGELGHWSQYAEAGLSKVSAETLKAAAKLAIDGAKTAEKKNIASEAAEQLRARNGKSLSYLEDLRNASDVSFQNLREDAPALADDEGLLVLFEAFSVERHFTGDYEAALLQKLKRFEQSGVASIGRKVTWREQATGPVLGYRPGEEVVRDTRVAWYKSKEGRMTLHFERQDGAFGPRLLTSEDIAPSTQPPFGPRNPLTRDAERGKPVPEEFWEVAIGTHRALWGTEPRTVAAENTPWDEAMDVLESVQRGRGPKPFVVPDELVLKPVPQQDRDCVRAPEWPTGEAVTR